MPTDLPSKNQQPAMRRNLVSTGFMLGLAVFAMAMRFAPLPPNFACFGALSLVSGLVLRGPLRWGLPLLAMFASDCIGNFFGLPRMGFYDINSFVLNYLGFAGMIGVGFLFSRWSEGRSSSVAVVGVCGSSVLASLVFFLISNFGCWLDPQLGYEASISGLMHCYYMGLPFWTPTIASDVLFGICFFSAYRIAMDQLAKTNPVNQIG